MDPVTILSVTCNVIQLVQTAKHAVSLCKQIYESGVDAETAALRGTNDALKDALASAATSTATAKSKPLKNTQQKCLSISTKLKAELDDLVLVGPRSPWAAVTKAAKNSFKASKIRKLQNELREAQRVLDSVILLGLSEELAKIDEQQLQRVGLLDQKVQDLYNELLQGRKKLDDMQTTLADIDSKINHAQQEQSKMHDQLNEIGDRLSTDLNHLSVQQATFQALQTAKAQQEKVLASLHFPEMSARHENIPEAHRSTLRWIFSPRQFRRSKKGSNFVSWLSGSESIYWISGKPGSGKSVLMNYLVDDRREDTLRHLARWSGGQQCTIVHAFLWEAGKNLQKSYMGLVRTLLYQLLEQDFGGKNSIWSHLQHELIQRSSRTWTKKQLDQVLAKVLTEMDDYLMISIDGLDECTDQELLLDLLSRLSANQNVKICASSRRETPFVQHLDRYAQLRMQDFNQRDIVRSIHDRLSVVRGSNNTLIGKLIENIERKAEGVFQWVDVVLKDVMRGIWCGDSEEQLYQRVDRMPGDIYKLYKHMLERNNPDEELYQSEACQFLRIAVSKDRLDLLTFWLAYDEKLRKPILDRASVQDFENFSQVSFDEKAKRIELCTAGLLHVTQTRKSIRKWCYDVHDFKVRQTGPAVLTDLMASGVCRREVGLIHRTVHEFLTQSPEGRLAIACNDPVLECTANAIYEANIAMLVLWHASGRYDAISYDQTFRSALGDGKGRNQGQVALELLGLLMRVTNRMDRLASLPWVYFVHDQDVSHLRPKFLRCDSEGQIQWMWWLCYRIRRTELHRSAFVEFLEQRASFLSNTNVALVQLCQSVTLKFVPSIFYLRPFDNDLKAIEDYVDAGCSLNSSFMRYSSPRSVVTTAEVFFWMKGIGNSLGSRLDPLCGDLIKKQEIIIAPCIQSLYSGRALDGPRSVLYVMWRGDKVEASGSVTEPRLAQFHWKAVPLLVAICGSDLSNCAEAWYRIDETYAEDVMALIEAISEYGQPGWDWERGDPTILDLEDWPDDICKEVVKNCERLTSASALAGALGWPKLEDDELDELWQMLVMPLDEVRRDRHATEMAVSSLNDRMLARIHGLKREPTVCCHEFYDWYMAKYVPGSPPFSWEEAVAKQKQQESKMRVIDPGQAGEMS